MANGYTHLSSFEKIYPVKKKVKPYVKKNWTFDQLNDYVNKVSSSRHNQLSR